jgi:hypothetical protein
MENYWRWSYYLREGLELWTREERISIVQSFFMENFCRWSFYLREGPELGTRKDRIVQSLFIENFSEGGPSTWGRVRNRVQGRRGYSWCSPSSWTTFLKVVLIPEGGPGTACGQGRRRFGAVLLPGHLFWRWSYYLREGPELWTREERISMVQSFFMENSCRWCNSLRCAANSVAAFPFTHSAYKFLQEIQKLWSNQLKFEKKNKKSLIIDKFKIVWFKDAKSCSAIPSKVSGLLNFQVQLLEPSTLQNSKTFLMHTVLYPELCRKVLIWCICSIEIVEKKKLLKILKETILRKQSPYRSHAASTEGQQMKPPMY